MSFLLGSSQNVGGFAYMYTCTRFDGNKNIHMQHLLTDAHSNSVEVFKNKFLGSSQVLESKERRTLLSFSGLIQHENLYCDRWGNLCQSHAFCEFEDVSFR